MQDVFKKSSNTYFVSEERPTLSFNAETCPNFAETLPTEISLNIFRKLDTRSLCNALLTCKLWYHIIEDSDHIWRDHCLVVRAVCQREIDGDRQGGMSWKVGLSKCPSLTDNKQSSFFYTENKIHVTCLNIIEHQIMPFIQFVFSSIF